MRQFVEARDKLKRNEELVSFVNCCASAYNACRARYCYGISVCLSVYMSVCLCLYVCMSVCLSVCLSNVGIVSKGMELNGHII